MHERGRSPRTPPASNSRRPSAGPRRRGRRPNPPRSPCRSRRATGIVATMTFTTPDGPITTSSSEPQSPSRRSRRPHFARSSPRSAGTNAGGSSPSTTSAWVVRRASRCHVSACCGVRPCRRATSDTTAPGSSVSATIPVVSSALQRRRPPAPLIISTRRCTVRRSAPPHLPPRPAPVRGEAVDAWETATAPA